MGGTIVPGARGTAPRPVPGQRIVTGRRSFTPSYATAVVVAVVDDPPGGCGWVALYRTWRPRRGWSYGAVTQLEWELSTAERPPGCPPTVGWRPRGWRGEA